MVMKDDPTSRNGVDIDRTSKSTSENEIQNDKNNDENIADMTLDRDEITCELLLFEELYKACEEAYEQGANSVDIYQSLHSPELIQKALMDAQKSSAESKRRKKSSSSSSSSSSSRFLQLFLNFNSILFHFALCTLISFAGYLLICHFLNVSPLYYFPSISEKRCLLPAHPVLLEMTRPIANCSVCTSDTSPVIEFKTTPLKEEFHAVVYSSRPIIIRGGAFQAGMPIAFNFAKLKAVFQSEQDGIDSVSDECQFLPFRSPFETLKEAFDTISDSATWARPWYIGWSNCHPGVAAKLRAMFPRPTILPADSESSAIDWIFIGSPGLGASMHIDYVRRPSWQAQLSGEKKWTLKPPPECENQCPKSISFIIHPGDILFVETNLWYHETLILGSNLSISIGSEYD